MQPLLSSGATLLYIGAKVLQKIEFHKSERKFFPKALLIFLRILSIFCRNLHSFFFQPHLLYFFGTKVSQVWSS